MSQLVHFATVGLFPTLKDFSVDALKWTDLVEGVVHQIASVRTVNTQHGQSTVLSLQREDGSCCTAWAWYAIARATAKPNAIGQLETVCCRYWEEDEQGTRKIYNSYKLMSL